ncbi:MAG: DUF2309 domain-containing protein [Hyphomonadaceae bacterium]|nr:DUF2309 domain-containing protein [Hyphomonadaceae bacterium]
MLAELAHDALEGPSATERDTPPADISAAARAACNRIAPLWPLKHFVAVNPFLGLADKSFSEASVWLERVARTDMLMPRAFYAGQIATGVINDADLAAAIETGPRVAGFASAADIKTALARPPASHNRPVVATVSEILDSLADGDREASRTAFMIEEISKWCATYFDEGQAAWRSPWRTSAPYAAWRAAMRHDRNAEAMGLRHVRETIAALPENPLAAIAHIVTKLGIPERAHEDYLFRALFDIQGWAAYARYRVWDANLRGREDDTLLQLLAIRLAWGFALFEERKDEAFRSAWRRAMIAAAIQPIDAQLRADDDLALRALLQEAYDHAAQRQLLAQLSAPPAALGQRARPAVQAAFCIDVRSEIFRRALEARSRDIETIGFAGFFGFPIEYVPIGNKRGGAQCPVLLAPSAIVCEAVKGAGAQEEAVILNARLVRRRAAKAWKAFKHAAVSSFAYVETIGLAFAARIVSDALGLTRPAPDPNRDGLSARIASRLGPRIAPQTVDGRATGFAPEARVATAEAVLRAMSMTENFARVVLLIGHGSTSVNNPHASGLDCGACGGHTGQANARVAAAILNDPLVRAGLQERGIALPQDTHFVAGLHDTTTDEVTLFDRDDTPETHRGELARIEADLAAAARNARAERAGLLGLERDAHVDPAIALRGRDWSQVRPEWGLAGNKAFIAAPRARTQHLELDGRAFLHTYDWRADESFATLELIMSAPMVVASWINLQYYGSSVNNRAFGSGNKTLHNVVGALGVLEGNGGDLRTGLPWQSVHNGKMLVHEPLRLSVMIEAPIAAINAVIAKHAMVRDLVENKWLQLFAIDPYCGLQRYWGQGTWTPAQLPTREAAGDGGN